MTVIRAVKLFIALAPVSFKTYENAKASNWNGTVVSDTIVQSYSGITPSQNRFKASDALVGLGPLFVAWLFGKIASRVLR